MPDATTTDTTTTEPLNLRGSEYAALAVGTVVAGAFGAVLGHAIGDAIKSMKDRKALGAGAHDNPYENPRYHYTRGGQGHYGYRPAGDRPGGRR